MGGLQLQAEIQAGVLITETIYEPNRIVVQRIFRWCNA
jgi:hypothetical protein